MELGLPDIIAHVDLDDRKGQLATRVIAQISVDWGVIEYELYRILKAADPTNWRSLAAKFFSKNSWKLKRKSVIEIVHHVLSDDPKIQQQVNSAIEDLGALCEQRNLITHGIWSGRDGNYLVQQLRWDTDAKALLEPIALTLDELHDIGGQIERIRQRLAALGTEVLTGWWLKRNSLRSVPGAASPSIQGAS